VTALLNFLVPPPGLDPHTDFLLDPVEGTEGLFSLRAVAEDGLRLFLLDPATVMDGYAPTLTDEQAADLGLPGPGEAMVLVVVHPAADGPCLNLMAPIVVNRTTGRAAQIILSEQDYPIRVPLLA